MQWYYVKGNDQAGPVSEQELAQLEASGDISTETLVWHEGLENWIAYGSVGAEAVPTSKLKLASDSDVSSTSGARAVEEAGTLSQLEDHAGEFMIYGGFWIRFVAKFIDGIILGAIGTGFSMAAIPAIMSTMNSGNAETAMIVHYSLQGVILLIQILYTVFFLGKFGATPGKMACRLKVVLPDGSPIGYGRALGRFFAEFLSALIIYIGYIIAGFDDEKRSLHDRICSTRVVKR